ncbi:N-myristoyl transferase [Aureobasidium melanogenum CBS 110374]|uniref:Glycylpeptide N-tetradecanoyltransferase n=1 Tax=Aureobasidium melanogenum (strain CBS 110374) TaxID=1043003 RepID=A0A074VTF3_AURM1|nr:N-myristoyl transferase [Aureobasidium melanogenum CBS 110374]KEQ63698.1 N-myristoyl transferase [Aureobasidium melanogenum CBS 110374]
MAQPSSSSDRMRQQQTIYFHLRIRNGKDPKDYKFWNTQPVPKLDDRGPSITTSNTAVPQSDGPILPVAVCDKIGKADSEKLIEGFEWCELDVTASHVLSELHDLLYNHYVEDDEGSFRLNYSPEFLSWALRPPGWKKCWHIGVRTKSTSDKTGRLVAFVAGRPVKLNVRSNIIDAVEINFLTIHQKLRGKRLAPVLIKEITRRCYREGIYQALYTAGTVLPSPVATCRYYHRSLDWEHLYKTGFSRLPRGITVLRQTLKYKLEKTATKGLRQMEPRDASAVKQLLNQYLARFGLLQTFTEEEVIHYFCSKSSKGIVYSYVVEHEGKITDFALFYSLEVRSSSAIILRSSATPLTIRTAYLYYYASSQALTPENKNSYAQHLQTLVHDLLILAKQAEFHVFNALTAMDNPLFLQQQKFEPGDSSLHFYLFNWRTSRLAGGMDDNMRADAGNMGGVGVVML